MKKVWEQEVLLLIGFPALLISVNEVEQMRKNGLLEIIAAHRTVKDLDELLKRDKLYQEALAEEQSASDIMDSLNLTSEQKKAVDRVITAYNECGAAYGAVAYRFGMEDGIRVRMELEDHRADYDEQIPGAQL